MSVPTRLASLVGRWQGTNRLHDPHSQRPEDTPSALEISSLLSGRFLRCDYTWSYQGKPQSGSFLIGGSSDGVLTTHWIDSWHMSDGVMACLGRETSAGQYAVTGSYAAPPGPDWGWRIEFGSKGNGLEISMINIWPDGKEEPAVEARYSRA